MPSTFKDLTPEQQAAFWAHVKRLGLTEADVIKTPDAAPDVKKVFVSSRGEHSHIKTKPFVIESVQHMKELVGIPDAHFANGLMRDRTVSYPAPLPKERLSLVAKAPNHCWVKDNLTHDEHANVKQAWQAYLVGDSRKISPDTVEMINAVHFPATVAVAAVQDLTVYPGQTYNFGTAGDTNSQLIVLGTLTIQAGGAVAFISPCTLQVQSTNAQAPNAPRAVQGVALATAGDPPAGNNFSFFTPAPATPGAPPNQNAKPQGGNAQPGQTGSSGGKNPTTVCTVASTGASGGDTGYPGTNGANAQNGQSPPPVIAHLGVITGTYNFFAGGGNGQTGGPGGLGGTGGQGGDGTAGAGPSICNKQQPAKGGLGGTGGNGGTPGNGAPGNVAYFYYTSKVQPFSMNVQTAGGFGGQAGSPGGGGAGGSGGADPGGTIPGYNAANWTLGGGPNGAYGNGGNPGTNATPGNVYLNPEPGT